MSRPVKAWVLFAGNGEYVPLGFAPSWRPSLDSDVLDIRYARADVRFSRQRLTVAALLGALHNSRVYVQRSVTRITVQVDGPAVRLATDAG